MVNFDLKQTQITVRRKRQQKKTKKNIKPTLKTSIKRKKPTTKRHKMTIQVTKRRKIKDNANMSKETPSNYTKIQEVKNVL